MKKALLTFLFLLLFSKVYSSEITFQIGDENILINGNPVKVTAPFEENGTTLVPVRLISEAFGAKVVWNDLDKSVNVSKDNIEISMCIDDLNVNINGSVYSVLCPPRLVGDTTMVPLRIILESFGAKVDYNEETREIRVSKDDDPSQEPVEDGYVQYINNDLNWKINIASDFKIDERIKNKTVFYKDDFKARLTIGVYNKAKTETLETAGDYEIAYIKNIYSSRGLTAGRGQNVFKNVLSEKIKYDFLDEELKCSASIMVFFCGDYKYVIHSYIETQDDIKMEIEKEMMKKMIDSFKFNLISHKLSEEYDYNYFKKYVNDDQGYTIGAPPSWYVDSSNSAEYILSDSLNKFKINLTCINYAKMNSKEQLNQYNLPVISRPNDMTFGDLESLYKKVFESKGGMKVKEGVTVHYWGVVSHGYKWVEPAITESFVKNEKVYIFDIDDRSTDDKEKMKKASICYLLYKDSHLFIIECKLSDYYNYQYNKGIYDDIVKTIFKYSNF